MNRSGESMAEEKSGKNVNSVSAQSQSGKLREPEVDSEAGPNNELSALRNAATRSTTGQDDFKGKPDPKKNTISTSHVDDYHKQVNAQLLQNGTKPSDIAYNSEGHPIVPCDETGAPITLAAGYQAEAVKILSGAHAKREQNKADGVFSKMFSGLMNASSSITDGLDGAADKSIEGIGKAVVEGGKAAGGAIDKTVDEFKNNEELQKYTGIALGAGGLPIAMASGVALSPVASSAAVAIANRVAMTPGAQDVIDFAKGANPISGVAPNPKNISEAAGAIISEFVQRNSR